MDVFRQDGLQLTAQTSCSATYESRVGNGPTRRGLCTHLVAEEWRAKADSKFGDMDALQASSSKVAALMDGNDACQHSQGRGNRLRPREVDCTTCHISYIRQRRCIL